MAIKKRTKDFADAMLADPTSNATKAYMATHETNNPRSAAVNAHTLLKKPEVQIYMEEHVNRAKQKIVQLIDSDKEEIAFRASESILDRNLGKPLTRTNNVNLSLTAEELLANLQ